MNKINRLKYAGVIAGVGLAVVVFSSGVYANTSSKETEKETEVEVISLDLSETKSVYSFDIEPVSSEEEDQK